MYHLAHSKLFITFFEIKFLPLLSPLECFYTCLESLLGTYVSSHLNLAHISLIPNFHYAFRNQIFIPFKSFGVFLCIFSKPFRYLCFISHTSHTFQTFTMHFEIKILSLLSALECFYACLVSLLGTYILSHTSTFTYGF